MKVLIGSYQCESNTFSKAVAKKADFEIIRGTEVPLKAKEVFEEHGYEIVPMPYAKALPSGKVSKSDYLEMLEEFLAIAKEHTDADGAYLYFHGAMFVEELGSGEEYFVKEFRKIVGNTMPISVACDFHGNLSDEYLNNIQALSSFRTAPHTDYDETEYRAANALVRILEEKQTPTLRRWHIPVLLADAAVTANEPYKTVIGMLSQLDAMEDVIACTVCNGQPWVDAPYVGASVVISYFGEGTKAIEVAQNMADILDSRKEEFAFTVPALSVEQAIKRVSNMEKPVFLSDSGDNTTAGAEGRSFYLLKHLIDANLPKTLVAGVIAGDVIAPYFGKNAGAAVSLTLCNDDGECYQLEGILQNEGCILGFDNEEAGRGIVVACDNVTVILSDVRTSFITKDHFERMEIDTDDFDIVAVKMGYLWPEVEKLSKSSIFVLTPGTSTNDFSTLNYQNLTQEYFYVKEK